MSSRERPHPTSPAKSWTLDYGRLMGVLTSGATPRHAYSPRMTVLGRNAQADVLGARVRYRPCLSRAFKTWNGRLLSSNHKRLAKRCDVKRNLFSPRLKFQSSLSRPDPETITCAQLVCIRRPFARLLYFASKFDLQS